jgi:hypothetical protein
MCHANVARRRRAEGLALDVTAFAGKEFHAGVAGVCRRDGEN